MSSPLWLDGIPHGLTLGCQPMVLLFMAWPAKLRMDWMINGFKQPENRRNMCCLPSFSYHFDTKVKKLGRWQYVCLIFFGASLNTSLLNTYPRHYSTEMLLPSIFQMILSQKGILVILFCYKGSPWAPIWILKPHLPKSQHRGHLSPIKGSPPWRWLTWKWYWVS